MSYWDTVTRTRLSRRRALIAGGASTAGAALLAACGSSSSTKSSPGENPPADQVTTPKDTVAQAKPGGTLRHFATGEPAHFDPLLSSNANVVNFSSPYAYPRLIKWVSGTYPKLADGAIEGFAAESYEVSPDKLQLTFKLRP